ncbi:hypothetical protein [Bacillus tropicus]
MVMCFLLTDIFAGVIQQGNTVLNGQFARYPGDPYRPGDPI